MTKHSFVPTDKHFGPITVNNNEIRHPDGRLVLAHELEPGKEYLIDHSTYTLTEKVNARSNPKSTVASDRKR